MAIILELLKGMGKKRVLSLAREWKIGKERRMKQTEKSECLSHSTLQTLDSWFMLITLRVPSGVRADGVGVWVKPPLSIRKKFQKKNYKALYYIRLTNGCKVVCFSVSVTVLFGEKKVCVVFYTEVCYFFTSKCTKMCLVAGRRPAEGA